MRTNRKSHSPVLVALTSVAAGALVLVAAPRAFAFGGSAERFPQQGNFVITNEAGIGWTQKLNDPTGTQFTLQPALEYFVIPNLSVGGHIVFAYQKSGDFSATSFGLAPEVGYALTLSDTWSFWPKARLGFTNTSYSPGASSGNVVFGIDAPFLVHPAEHFFFGAGPALYVDLTGQDGRKTTSIGINFIIGGYFAQ